MRKLLIITLFIAPPIYAQHFGSIANGNYSGIHAAKINPALTAYSKYNWHLNLVGVWANVNNNYLTLKLPYSAYKLRNNSMPDEYKTANGNPDWRDEWLKENTNGLRKHAAVGAMLYGPSFTITINNTWHVGIVTDATALGRVSGISENLAHAFYKQLDTAKGAFDFFKKDANGNINTIKKFTASGNAWVSGGINVSKSIPMKWKQQLLVGATLKRAWGLGGAYWRSEDMNLRVVNDDSVTLDKTNIRIADYSNIRGKGLGLDIGGAWVYHKPEYLQPGGYKDKHTMYQFKFGFSLLDIGSIKYKDAYTTTIVNSRPIGWNVTEAERRYKNSEPSIGLLDSVLGEIPNLRTETKNVKIGLPTRLVLSADYQVKPRWFVNMQAVQSLRSKYSQHARHQSYLMVAPRYETDFFEFSLPLLLEYDYRAFRAGAALRVGPLYLGTNSLWSMMRTRSLRDADFFIGIAFGDLPGKYRDRWLKEKESKKAGKQGEDCEKM